MYCLAILPVQLIFTQLKKWLGLNNNFNINYLVRHAWFSKDEKGYYMHPVIKEVVKRMLDIQESSLCKLLNSLKEEINYKKNPIFEDFMKE